MNYGGHTPVRWAFARPRSLSCAKPGGCSRAPSAELHALSAELHALSAELRETRLSHALLPGTGPASRDSPTSACRRVVRVFDFSNHPM